MLCNSLQSWVCQEHISNVRTKIPKSESKTQQIIAEKLFCLIFWVNANSL